MIHLIMVLSVITLPIQGITGSSSRSSSFTDLLENLSIYVHPRNTLKHFDNRVKHVKNSIQTLINKNYHDFDSIEKQNFLHNSSKSLSSENDHNENIHNQEKYRHHHLLQQDIETFDYIDTRIYAIRSTKILKLTQHDITKQKIPNLLSSLLQKDVSKWKDNTSFHNITKPRTSKEKETLLNNELTEKYIKPDNSNKRSKINIEGINSSFDINANNDCDRVKRSTTKTYFSRVSGSKNDEIHETNKKKGKKKQIISSIEKINIEISSVSVDKISTISTITKRGKRRRRGRRRQHQQSKDLALFIDERQVKLVSGYMMEIPIIHDGQVLPYILDPNFEKYLPVIPFEVQHVNFTWRAGRKRYNYTFDRLHSHDQYILEAPVVSIPTQGRIPRRPKVFTVNINCSGNATGIAAFDFGLLIETRRGKPLPGTPLRVKLRKECTQPSADPECDEKCENGGICDVGRKCQCPEGYMGPYCKTALCYPQCMHGGICTTPGRCSCPPGYQGRHCEGGICQEKCENGGKCIQKDTCSCPRGYYGNRCEFSKCVIPCVNGGRCRNVNKCKCPHGFAGDHCEVITGHVSGGTNAAATRCSRKCRHGTCRIVDCVCEEGFTGRWCKRRGTRRKRVWM